MKRVHGIYVPGLGDSRSLGQDKAIKDWSKLGVDLAYHPVGWAVKEPFAKKLGELCAAIDALYEDHGPVALVGSSAGASAVLNAYAARPDKVQRVISICGKIYNPESLTEKDFDENPAFKESLDMLPATIESFSADQLDTILSVYPWYDGRVPVDDAKLLGSNMHRVHMIGHVASIATAISVAKKPLAQFALAA